MPPPYTTEDVLIFNPHWTEEQATAWLAAYQRNYDLCLVDGPEPEDLERAGGEGNEDQACTFQAARIADEVAWRLCSDNEPRELPEPLEAAVVAALAAHNAPVELFRTACEITLLADGDVDDDGLIEGKPIQICKTGHFPPRDLDITDEMLEAFVANADPEVFGKQIHFDYDHASEFKSDNPQEAGKAAGWLKSLFIEDGALWAIPRWTKAAYDAIKAGEWKYISPAFALNYTKDDGTELGPALTSIALTNHPFLKGMEPIAASETAVIDMTKASSTPPRRKAQMPPIKLELEPKTIGLSEDATPEQATEQITKIFGEHKSFAERIEALTGMVKSVFVKLGLKEDEVPDLDAEDADEKVAAAADTRVAALTEKKDPKPEPGTVVLSEKKLAELEAMAAAGSEAAKELHDSKREAAVEKLLQERKITPAQKEYAAKLYDKDLEMFEEWAGTLTPIAALSDKTIGDDVDEPDDDSASAEFNRLVQEKVDKSDGKVDHRTAYMTVQRENPELAKRVLREHREQ